MFDAFYRVQHAASLDLAIIPTIGQMFTLKRDIAITVSQLLLPETRVVAGVRRGSLMDRSSERGDELVVLACYLDDAHELGPHEKGKRVGGILA